METEIVLRRTLAQDGRTRAFVNDESVGVALLRDIGSALLEDVAAETPEAGHAIGEIDFGIRAELIGVVAREHRRRHRFGVASLEPLFF